MTSARRIYVCYGLFAALLFGAGSQFSKLMLTTVPPVTMAGLLYTGSGVGLLLMTAAGFAAGKRRNTYEARPTRRDLPWLAATMFFGTFLGPVALMFSLPHTPAATAALLLSFEAVATTVIAVLWKNEPVGRRMGTALLLITLSCIMLSYTPDAAYGISLGALGVLLACSFWGLDNNIIQNISGKDPVLTIMAKALIVGPAMILAGYAVAEVMPAPATALACMAIGFMGFGGIMSVSLLLAIRGLGSGRAASLFALSPFFGVVFAFLLFAEMPGGLFFIALAVMLAGTFLLATERHAHEHAHPALEHEHRHRHDDLHHDHAHVPGMPPVNGSGFHSHPHGHDGIVHTHAHSPDIHHRHRHDGRK
ncbi:MAG: DMT family transporter [Methanomicrobiales archaeon]|nr:DMT family transporter [Methanomicrobiales archaeon]